MLSLVHCSLLFAGARSVMGSAWYQRGVLVPAQTVLVLKRSLSLNVIRGKCLWKGPGQNHGRCISWD